MWRNCRTLKAGPSGAPVLLGQVARPAVIAARAGAGSDNPNSAYNQQTVNEDVVWAEQGFPAYLQRQPTSYNLETCQEFANAVTEAEQKQSAQNQGIEHVARQTDNILYASVWQSIRREAAKDAASEPMLSSALYASILAHDTFERALAFVLANRLANAVLLPTQLFEIFYETIMAKEDVRLGALADIEACRERDPACVSCSQALLYFKGFHAIQTHRVGHSLWQRGQKVLALVLQSRISEVFAVDIHPAARIGRGILLDHGTGVVIGETAVIGNNCSLLQVRPPARPVPHPAPKLRAADALAPGSSVLFQLILSIVYINCATSYFELPSCPGRQQVTMGCPRWVSPAMGKT